MHQQVCAAANCWLWELWRWLWLLVALSYCCCSEPGCLCRRFLLRAWSIYMNVKSWNILSVILLLAVCPSLLGQQSKDDHPVQVAAIHKDSGASPSAAPVDSDNSYSIGPEDVL